MDETVKKRKHPDRITLSPTTLERLTAWATQVNESSPGTKITRSDLISWLVDIHPSHLSSKELSDLGIRFHDEMKFARWALQEITRARSRGEKLSIKLVNESSLGREKIKVQKKSKEIDSSMSEQKLEGLSHGKMGG